MILRSNGPYFVVVSPAYIHDIMNGQAVEGVISPDNSNPWDSVRTSKRLGPIRLGEGQVAGEAYLVTLVGLTHIA